MGLSFICVTCHVNVLIGVSPTQERKEQPEARSLLQRMQALERYPTTRPVASSPDQYAHAEVSGGWVGQFSHKYRVKPSRIR